MNDIFSEKELTIRKWWLYFLIAYAVWGIVDTFIPPKPTVDSFLRIGIGVGIPLIYKGALFYFGYLKNGIKLLAFSIFSFAISVAVLILSFTLSSLPVLRSINEAQSQYTPYHLGADYLFMAMFMYFTLQMFFMNRKTRKTE